MKGERWNGVGYNQGGGAAADLVGGPGGRNQKEPAEDSAEEVSPQEEPAGPSMSEQWRQAAQELVKPDVERHRLPGLRRRALRRLTLGAYKGLEPEEVWRRRLAENRALAPMPADVGVGTVVVAQPKGGVGKSPVAVMTACGLERFTRLSPILWDCNENAGGRWTVRRFARTAEHLLGEPEKGTVLSQVEATAIDQDNQAYEVIAAPHPPRNLTDEEFETVYGKLTQRFTQVIIDTGNTVTARNFVNSVRRADIVVVPTDLAAATMAPTLALFEVLESQWGQRWGEHVVGVVTNPIAEPDEEWAKFFTDKCTEVVQVPFDPHIAAKSVVTWTDMAPSTRQACLQLAGAITDIYRNRKTEETQS